MEKTLVINLFSGPGVGKSSSMGGIFSELKWRGLNCEQAPEFAKEKVWEESTAILQNQIYVFGKQLNTLHRINGKVDVAITDSPLLLSLIYGKGYPDSFNQLVLDMFDSFNNFNVLLKRHKAYNPSGRLQTEDEAKEIDHRIKYLLIDNNIDFWELDSGRESIMEIADRVEEIIGSERMVFK